MGLQLPGELVSLLHILGYNWPQADEQKLFQMGQRWSNFSGTITDTVGGAERAAAQVWQNNSGQDIAAFAEHIRHQDGPLKVLGDSSTATTILGVGMTICSAIVLALKVQVIVQLVTLAIQIAQAIAMAAATFGASLAQIPIFQQISRRLVGMLIDQVIGQLLNA